MAFPAFLRLLGWLGSGTKEQGEDVFMACFLITKDVRVHRKCFANIAEEFLDRIDLHLEVPSLGVDEQLISERLEETSASIRERVVIARKIQKERFKDLSGLHCNAHMSTSELRKFCKLSQVGQGLLRGAIDTLGLSARAYDRILKVGRTLADLDGSDSIAEHHLAEAIHYRSMDRRLPR